MPQYIDYIVVPVTKKNIKDYSALAKKSAKIWMKHGALECIEAVAEDAPKGKVTSFPQSVKLKSTEIVVVTQIVYRSRSHREQVADKVRNDSEMQKIWESMPINMERMIFGGFEVLVSSKKS